MCKKGSKYLLKQYKVDEGKVVPAAQLSEVLIIRIIQSFPRTNAYDLVLSTHSALKYEQCVSFVFNLSLGKDDAVLYSFFVFLEVKTFISFCISYIAAVCC